MLCIVQIGSGQGVWRLLDMSLRVLGSIEQRLGFFAQTLNLILEDADLVLEVRTIELVDVNYVVVAMLANGATEADA